MRIIDETPERRAQYYWATGRASNKPDNPVCLTPDEVKNLHRYPIEVQRFIRGFVNIRSRIIYGR